MQQGRAAEAPVIRRTKHQREQDDERDLDPEQVRRRAPPHADPRAGGDRLARRLQADERREQSRGKGS